MIATAGIIVTKVSHIASGTATEPPDAAGKPPRLLDQVRARMRRLGLAGRTEEAYVSWIRRFILSQGKRHPRDMGAPEVEAFLTDLALNRGVAASTQNQALAALLYGSGLRLLECLRLRVQDLDFARREVFVRHGKGGKDRRTVLPAGLEAPLRAHLVEVRRIHERDLAAGFGAVWLPDALARKFPGAPREWGWQYVFPARRRPAASPVPGVMAWVSAPEWVRCRGRRSAPGRWEKTALRPSNATA